MCCWGIAHNGRALVHCVQRPWDQSEARKHKLGTQVSMDPHDVRACMHAHAWCPLGWVCWKHSKLWLCVNAAVLVCLTAAHASGVS